MRYSSTTVVIFVGHINNSDILLPGSDLESYLKNHFVIKDLGCRDAFWKLKLPTMLKELSTNLHVVDLL